MNSLTLLADKLHKVSDDASVTSVYQSFDTEI